MRWRALAALAAILPATLAAAADPPCASDAQCGPGERCQGVDTCGEGVCAPAFTLERFPLPSVAADAYSANLFAVLDHQGEFFYTQCCDTQITAYTGETALRGPDALCPAPPDFPACFLRLCTCAYRDPEGEPFVINGHYIPGSVLFYDGHAGYDYVYVQGTPIHAPKAGLLCKAGEDRINGRVGVATAWDKFHTFYIDHGLFDGVGWSSWYLHAADLAGQDVSGNPLRNLDPGECAEVADGQLVATVGNFGTLAPHLHFEVRRYLPADGPESSSARSVDPYGWSGEGPDPLLQNTWAQPQDAPIWVGCGNGRVECGEGCDDGNTVEGDGCSPTCEKDPLLECQDDLARVRAELDQCLAEPRFPDADVDGETDATDRCPETPPGSAVDDAGCSNEQFCGAISLRSFRGLLHCYVADWRNDDWLERWSRDCRPGQRPRRCVAR